MPRLTLSFPVPISRWLALLAIALATCGASQNLHAQITGGIGGVAGAAGAAGTAGVAGAGGQAGQGGAAGSLGNVGGILVDAKGVVRPMFVKDKSGTLDRKRREALAGNAVASEVMTASPLRKISLVRLEAACRTFARDRTHVSSEIQYLAGLQRIDYLFVDPEGKDLVLAGPAEAYVFDASGRAVGVTSGRPPLRLDDLLVALRALERGGGTLGCSIDPNPDRLAKLQAFLKQTSGAMTRQQAEAKFAQLAPILGKQDVRIFGIPGESHFAEVVLDADYRMKRYSLGLDPAPVKGFKSHLALVGPNENAMQRWWFAPLYDAFTRSPDGLAFAFQGQRVQLMSQEELVSDSGQRSSAPFTHLSSQKYAKQFTERYAEIAAAIPVYAELQNLFDLAVMAALLKKERLAEKIGWRKELFLDSEQASIVPRNVPRQVDSLCNFKTLQGRTYVAQVAGGVTIDPWQMVLQNDFARETDSELSTRRSSALPIERPQDHAWWWD